MIQADWWTWKCARCGWEAKSARTVNYQQSVAEMLVRLHIQQHDQGGRVTNAGEQETRPAPETQSTPSEVPHAEALRVLEQELRRVVERIEMRSTATSPDRLMAGKITEWADRLAALAVPGGPETP